MPAVEGAKESTKIAKVRKSLKSGRNQPATAPTAALAELFNAPSRAPSARRAKEAPGGCPGVAYRRDGEGGEEERRGQRFATTDKSLGHGEPTDARSPTHATTIINHPALVLVLTSISLAAITTTYTTTKILKRTLAHPSRLLPSSPESPQTPSSVSTQLPPPPPPTQPHNTTTPPRVSPRFVRARRRPTQKPQSSMIVGP
ncbi:hypothetical protein CNYM01_04818 [Colletotrichum nymphaeae SA-01]|uniref:Uncharacterized protein n=1 Tax=Colletotrichum nymphaeae SA-01 TaxID=1460502 RepID=A0A135UXQ7_9PEZI|nr:hypothetical protein CNYM01_04818 [Colletotrichum nymphaeae SA-01]